MPELPDIEIYREALEQCIKGRTLLSLRITHPFLLRTADPPVGAVEGKEVTAIGRIGKRIAIELEGGLHVVIHLMIAGRLHWRMADAPLRTKSELAGFYFPSGTLVLTEAGTKKRASLHLINGAESLRAIDPGGLDILQADLAAFTHALQRENHTVKRALTDPRLFSGIGNAYSDEILFHARLSPAALTQRMTPVQIDSLFTAAHTVLTQWIDRLRRETNGEFPEKVTAFHKEMAVHGRYHLPCPVCGSPIQRIRYAENEANYCARCQTDGRLLADRALSRLLKQDWPRTLEELELRIKNSRLPDKEARRT
jgi:formamidopyrimidine-DNA glycosylase